MNIAVILTRFSRVTFHAAHKYLGLTAEVMRTEKVINDLACHPLPSSFYEGGGLESLRHRFDFRHEDHGVETDYFNSSHSRLSSGKSSEIQDYGESSTLTNNADDIATPLPTWRNESSRHLVQAGDLHTTTSDSTSFHPLSRAISFVGFRAKSQQSLGKPMGEVLHEPYLSNDGFNLRDEVMSCIAKSIGLLQPPLSGANSLDVSPISTPVETPFGRFNSFGTLSLLEIGDEASSATAPSTVSGSGQVTALDNEVEILFYPAGSVLTRAGGHNAGQ